MKDTVIQGPITESHSKRVMLRAERHDTIAIEGWGRWTIVRRTDTYYGPCLLIAPADAECNFNLRLTAPGPGAKLQLWFPARDRPGYHKGWHRGPEVEATIIDTEPYEICEGCGEPVKTVEHERVRLFTQCPGGFGGESA